ncbi:sulfatase [Algibacter amylolyticus]|uniref:Sulfatase n=1 Tax=Algibacter amylolyticus TaxID=1608400 RepID=A0A5M7B8X7_9FLAO|nr:sulfatase [Algibacter amylolyticus]KAA5825150.1 sulfatase [Algibacter amylolyticus]MBB5268741.1 arylsulfatase A-like enzyme [Algibacter amylolyticus]TSJ77644.1 sulfatase [Algibacter amylolyticus]
MKDIFRQTNTLKLMVLCALFSVSIYAQKPNVVFICVDDMNSYGLLKEYAPLEMPYLDKLREQSVVFENSYCASPVCMPSRASFFSGKYPHNTGNYRNGKNSTSWITSEVLQKVEAMPEFFKRNGYETWASGKLFHAKIPQGREDAMFDNSPVHQGGFGPFPRKENQLNRPFWGVDSFPDEEFPDVKNADAAIEFLNEEHEKPFFLYYGLYRPHTPFTAPKRFFDMYDIDKITIPEGYNPSDLDDIPKQGRKLVDGDTRFQISGAPTPDIWKKMIRGYCATNSFADWNVGRLIEALDKSSYSKNTIVVLISDNGYHCGEKNHWEKSTLWDIADKVPVVIRTPETKGAVCTNPVSLVDIYPTLVDYCGLEQPTSKLDGISMLPFIKNPSMASDRAVLTTYGEQYSSVSNGRYRYIQYPDGSEEFYDHESDPHEWKNIISNPEILNAKNKLKKEIPETWHPALKNDDK